MSTALAVLDLLLALGACLRLTRFVVADDVPGGWWLKDPLHDRKHAYQRPSTNSSPLQTATENWRWWPSTSQWASR